MYRMQSLQQLLRLTLSKQTDSCILYWYKGKNKAGIKEKYKVSIKDNVKINADNKMERAAESNPFLIYFFVNISADHQSFSDLSFTSFAQAM